jgi:TRAP transporter TAXI family solute receptor
MRRLARVMLAACALAGAFAVPTGEAREAQTVVTIGTGPLRGIYYPVARAICRVVNRELRAERIRCSPEATFGSVYNVEMLRAGELDFALVQADVQHQALAGLGRWAGRPASGLQAVFGVLEEGFVIVARPGAEIGRIEDLRGLRVATGMPGSGTRATWDALAVQLGWQGADRVRAAGSANIAEGLCAGSIDAAVAVAFHPTPAVRDQLAACATRLVPVTGPALDRLLAEQPYFRRVTIAAGAYGTPASVETFGVASDFVAGPRADPRIVAAIARVVATHLEELSTQVPALAQLGARGLPGPGLTAPLHPAAAAVYREFGARP